jgi:ABC-2 type transport system permease protein
VVAHLLRLKLHLLRNGLRRSVAAIVGMVVGVLYGGGFVLVGLAALISLRAQGDLQLARSAVVIAGAGLVAAWALLPILLFGVDPTLDPTRFATFAVRERTLAVGLVLTALVGLPGVATTLLVLGSVVAGSRSVPSTLAALVGGLLGLLTCVLLSRIGTAAASAVLATRRGRDVAGIGGLLLFVSLGPVLAGLTGGGLNRATVDRLAEVLAWTPLSWAWAPAGDLALGDWGGGLLRLGLAAVFCLGLLVVWERLLVSVLRNPRSASSDGGKVSGGLGLFARMPGTPMGAIAARAGTYWIRDPRFNVPAVMTILLPAGLLIPGIGSDSELALLTMPLASAYLIGWGQHNDVGYDSTAFWMHVASGVDVVSDRLGRLFPSGLMAVACVPLYAVLGPVFGAPWRLLPATFGVGCALALNGFAVACVTSAVKQYAVPAPGENPFTSRPGSAGVTLGVQAVCGAAVFTLSIPALALGVLAYLGWQWAAWAALVVGPALGVVALVVGTRMGADLFRRRQAILLQDLVSMR